MSSKGHRKVRIRSSCLLAVSVMSGAQFGLWANSGPARPLALGKACAGLFAFARWKTVRLQSQGFGPCFAQAFCQWGAPGPRTKIEASAEVTQGRESQMANPSPSSLGQFFPMSDAFAALSRGLQQIPWSTAALSRAAPLSPWGLRSKEASGVFTATHSITLYSLLPFPGLSLKIRWHFHWDLEGLIGGFGGNI